MLVQYVALNMKNGRITACVSSEQSLPEMRACHFLSFGDSYSALRLFFNHLLDMFIYIYF